MTSAKLRIALPAIALIGAVATPVLAQKPPSPEQRIAILEQQVAAGQAAAIRLDQRLDSIERQLQQLINQGEVNGHRANELESEIGKLRTDMDARLIALESRPAPEPQAAEQSVPADAGPKPKAQTASTNGPEAAEKSADSTDATPSDPGEDAYSDGFHLWRDGKYDAAISTLKSFVANYPDHRRASFARNLIGRALLDKGQPRAAAEALLANYRADPKGERAPDSLYYLGQSLMTLNQPGQACKAYAELEDVYGKSIRPDLKTLVTKAKSDAHCS